MPTGPGPALSIDRGGAGRRRLLLEARPPLLFQYFSFIPRFEFRNLKFRISPYLPTSSSLYVSISPLPYLVIPVSLYLLIRFCVSLSPYHLTTRPPHLPICFCVPAPLHFSKYTLFHYKVQHSTYLLPSRYLVNWS